MNESQNAPEFTNELPPVESTIVDPVVDPVNMPQEYYDRNKIAVEDRPGYNADRTIEHIDEVQPGKLKAVGDHATDGPVKLGTLVLFEGRTVAIVTGVWENTTLNLTLFPDALPMLDVKSKVPFRTGEAYTNTWEYIK
jgi:hypothetical protein